MATVAATPFEDAAETTAALVESSETEEDKETAEVTVGEALPDRSEWDDRHIGAFTIAESPRFTTVVALRDAIEGTGLFYCESWQQRDHVTNAIESGNCSDSDVLSIYDDKDALMEQIAIELQTQDILADAEIDEGSVLIGYNWIFKHDSASAVQFILGGSMLEDLDQGLLDETQDDDTGELPDAVYLAGLRLAWEDQSADSQAQMCEMWGVSPSFIIAIFQDRSNEIPERVIRAFFQETCE